MWKFKVSKFKNAAPKVPKKEEWIGDVPVTQGFQSCGNHVAASCAFMAFNVDNGGSLGLLPIDTRGRQSMAMPLLHCHGDFVTDFEFSPHDDHLLCTGSQDCSVRMWRIPPMGLGEMPCNVETSLTTEGRRIENVHWHPTAGGVVGVTSDKTIKVFDVAKQEAIYVGDMHGDQIQSFSWHGNGSMLVTSCKDKTLRLIDPRAKAVTQETKGHASIRDSRALWLGETPFIVSTGFDSSRGREVRMWDTRNFSSSVATKTFDTSNGVMMPFYDADTNMLFLAGKGDTTIYFMETTEKSPYLTDGSVGMLEQIKGIGMVPKRAMDVMNAEVNRLLVLTKNAVIPVPYQVPRKAYNEFYPELYPDTFSGEPAMTADQWISGQNDMPSKVSLDPSQKGRASSGVKPAMSPKPKPQQAAAATPTKDPVIAPSHNVTANSPTSNGTNGKAATPPKVTSPPEPEQPRLKPKPHKMFAGVHHPKFRHLKATVLHRDNHIDNIRHMSQSMPGESDFFHVNAKFAAVPLSGSGGLISILNLSETGKLPDTGVPALQNGCMVMDFEWDPFDNHRLAVAGDDAKVRTWRIPEGGVTETLTSPEVYLRGHTEKVYFTRFHPVARDILATASYDMTVRVWDLTSGDDVITLEGHTDAIFCLSWSPDGKKLATVSKDGKIRVYDPRKSTQPISEGPGPSGSRGARVVWACGGMFLAVSGFNKSSERLLLVYEAFDLSAPVASQDIDRAPAILIPFYDEDSSTIFLTGRGDSIVYAFEIHEDPPYLHQLSSYSASGLHQALSFLPKNLCEVRKVEFARAYRLTSNSLEPVSFTVPRIKMEYFQDDLFPETRVAWEPALTADEWLAGTNRLQEYVNLRPSDMMNLSEAPVEAPKPKKYESHAELTVKTDEQKKEELVGAIVKKLGIHDEPLPQDLTEGVDEDEWDD